MLKNRQVFVIKNQGKLNVDINKQGRHRKE